MLEYVDPKIIKEVLDRILEDKENINNDGK